ncbi:hypothetical protein GCM10025738_27100 [Microbacterium fluvii]
MPAPARAPHGVALPRLALMHLERIADDPDPRAVVIGSAGSGKTAALRLLRGLLEEAGRAVMLALPGGDDVQTAPGDVLLVDDAHLWPPAALDRLAARVRDTQAATVVACRPWPSTPALRDVLALLEGAHPPVMLGQLSATDLAHAADAVAPACIDDLLARTGRITWLAREALAAHDADACAGGLDHAHVDDALQELIAHRLASLPAPVHDGVEHAALRDDGAEPAVLSDEIADAGHAAGLLQRNGRPAPVVAAAIRATAPAERVALFLTSPTGAAGARGAEPAAIALGLARAQWARGDLDGTGSALDAPALRADDAARAAGAGLAASLWAARGLMREAHAAAGPETADAAITGFAVGRPIAEPSTAAPGQTTREVALRLLCDGLRSPDLSGLADLVLSSELYTASGAEGAVPELPAVVAAAAAVHAGDLAIATAVLDAALRGGHGGEWAQPRLLLWRAWVDLQRQLPHEAESHLAAALGGHLPLAPREGLLRDALRIGLARRYGDASDLASAWAGAQESLLRVRIDLFGILPLTEFAVAAARVGDVDRVRPHLSDALAILAGLGSPPLWAPHLHWAGIQQGILDNRPAALRPHAQALLAAAAHSPVAAIMAHAGRVWTAVLSGDVDAEAIEAAALDLAGIGLAWDAARLAGHGAGRTDDRRAISRLLACARQLHPPQQIAPATAAASPATTLSMREREVAVLVVQGMTYAEIGEAIFISPRTAEHHIARIRRRLGATSRSDLIAKLRLAMAEPPASDEHEGAFPLDLAHERGVATDAVEATSIYRRNRVQPRSTA